MRTTVTLLGLCGTLIAAGVAHASSPGHVGNWAYEDASLYIGVALERDGTCKVVEVAKRDDGLGFHCKYSEREGRVQITEIWDSAGVRQDASTFKMNFQYDGLANALILDAETPVHLKRVPKLASELAKDWPRDWLP
jgi:hypothetical protein